MRRGQGDERERVETGVRRFSERHGLLPESGRVVVAVSGGADSLCLLGALDALCGPDKLWPEIELVVAHLDHGLRGAEGQADAAWVAQVAAQLGWRVALGSADVTRRAQGGNAAGSTALGEAPSSSSAKWRGIEDAARRARYAFLRGVARDEGATRICVGHTADDQAETLILNWLRGSGLTGLTGMRPLAGGIARPLLGLRRGDTHAYCAARGWQPRLDATNADDRFARNRVRHQLLPTLKQFNSNLVPTLVRNAELLAEDESYLEATAADALEEIASDVTEDEVALDAVRLIALPAALRRRVVRQAVVLLAGGGARGAGTGPSPLDARHVALVAALAATHTGHAGSSAVELPGGLVATAEPERVVLRRRKAGRAKAVVVPAERAPVVVPLPVPGSADLPELGWRVRALLLDAADGALPPGMEAAREGGMGDADPAGEGAAGEDAPAPGAGTEADAGRAHMRAYLDAGAAGGPLYVRAWQPGDRFQPLGMSGERKLQDYFVDAKVPREERGRIPLVWGPSHLLWIAGHRIDERARLTETTQRVLALRLEALDGSAEPGSDEDAQGAVDAEIVEIWEASPEAAVSGEIGIGELDVAELDGELGSDELAGSGPLEPLDEGEGTDDSSAWEREGSDG